jgi:tetratricopeptide (TPR) repeat protein
MRKLITPLLCMITTSCIAQTNTIDSLKTSLINEKKDSSRAKILLNLSYAFSNLSIDSSLSFAQQALALARQSAFVKGEARCLEKIRYDYASLGNYPKSLQLELDALKKAETINDSDLVAAVYDAIANTYSMQNDMRTSADYDLKALDMVRSTRNKRQFTSVLMNIGDSYEKLNILDSARHFTNEAYELSLQLNDPGFIGNTLDNLGNISLKMHQDAIAIDYYRADLPYLKSVNDNEALCETYLNMAKLFKTSGNNDSCLYYAKHSLITGQISSLPQSVMNACDFLTGYYKSIQNVDSAFAYQSEVIVVRDSLLSQEKLKAVQEMTFQENIRQQEIAEQKKQAEEDVKRNIQRAGIAVFIPLFFLFLLLLSRTKIKSRTVEFLAIVGLLLFFEFITDLLYPYISNWTNESPAWETLIFVIIAACLEPISFRLEHWIKKKLVHKTLHSLTPAQS